MKPIIIFFFILGFITRAHAGVVFTCGGGRIDAADMMVATTQGGPIAAEFIRQGGFSIRGFGGNAGFEGADDAEFVTSCVSFTMDGLAEVSGVSPVPLVDDTRAKWACHVREWETLRLTSLGFLSSGATGIPADEVLSDKDSSRIPALVDRLASESSARWFGLMGGLLLFSRWCYRR